MNRIELKLRPITDWLYRYRIHLIAWILFMFWESVMVGYFFNVFGKPGNYIIHYAINIIFFYGYASLLEHATLYRRQAVWKVPLYIIIQVFIYVILVYQIDNLLYQYTDFLTGKPGNISSRVSKLLYRATFFMLFSTGYFFLKRYVQEREEKLRIEKLRFQMLLDKERMDKELEMSKNAFLKAQVNPHLLFNTFEFLHQKIRKHAPDDAKVMVYLSDMVRFAASTKHQDGYIRLGDEIEQCENLIKLHQHTQGRIYISLGYSDDVAEITMIPLVLMTILENLFKHGNLTDSEYKASIDIFMHNDALTIESRNLPGKVKSKIGFGSGLENIRSRLDYSYGSDAVMEAGTDEEGYYTLHISIKMEALEKAHRETLKSHVKVSSI